MQSKKSEVQKFEPVLSTKHMPVSFTLVSMYERRKSEVNFEADYVSDSFMDETQNLKHIILNRNGTDCC